MGGCVYRFLGSRKRVWALGASALYHDSCVQVGDGVFTHPCLTKAFWVFRGLAKAAKGHRRIKGLSEWDLKQGQSELPQSIDVYDRRI